MQLIKYEAARQALQEAHTIDEVKQIRDKAEALRAYARQAKDVDMTNWAAEIRIRAERKMGEMLIAMREAGELDKGGRPPENPSHDGSGFSSPKLADMGITHNMSSRAQTIARVPEEKFEEVIAEHTKAHKELTSNTIRQLVQPAHYSSESNEWYTPARYLAAVHEVLGEIDLDPASCEKANETVQAKMYFTEGALERYWHGSVFMNPPYGKDGTESMAGKFCNKLIAEYRAGRVYEAILLVNSLHSQKWQAPLYDFPICFVDHRIKFVSGEGKENENPTFQNIFVYLGDNPFRFAEVFGEFGYVMEPQIFF